MKTIKTNPILLAGIVLFLIISCKTTTNITPQVEEPPVADVVEMHQDAATMAIAQATYYVIENHDSEAIWVEKSVEGDVEMFMHEGKERMRITIFGTGKVVLTEERMHPQINEKVFLDIGGDTQTRER